MFNLGSVWALLLQFSFTSIALPLLTSFRFSTLPFSFFSFIAKAAIFLVFAHCNLNVTFLNFINSKFSFLARVQCLIVLVSGGLLLMISIGL